MENITGFAGLTQNRLPQNRLTLPSEISPEVSVIAPNNTERTNASEAVDFSKVLEGALDHVSGMQESAAQMQADIELGRSDDLVGTMIASQKASLAFQGVVQARNRVVSAYETVFNMAV